MSDIQAKKACLSAALADFEKQERNLQAACKHERFIADDDGDCHSPGWYYTCKDCGYLTKFRPKRGASISFK